jgi:hypothetical protein
VRTLIRIARIGASAARRTSSVSLRRDPLLATMAHEASDDLVSLARKQRSGD